MLKLLKFIGSGLMILLLLLGLMLGMPCKAETVRLYVMVKVDSTLTVRAEPKTDGEVLGTLERGNGVTVLATDGEWRQIERESLTGWVHSDYLSEVYPPFPYGGAYTVTAEPSLNVRDNPKGAVVARLKAGTTVYVFERYTDEDGAAWSKLDEGWVMSQYIAEVEDDG